MESKMISIDKGCTGLASDTYLGVYVIQSGLFHSHRTQVYAKVSAHAQVSHPRRWRPVVIDAALVTQQFVSWTHKN